MVMTPRHCERCGKPLTRRQMAARCTARFCSLRCWAIVRWRSRQVHGHKQPVIRDAVLSILRGNTAWWMTASDMAIWIYGYDDAAECRAIHVTVHRLRKSGHIILSRRLPLSTLTYKTIAHGYRLIEQVQQVAVSA